MKLSSRCQPRVENNTGEGSRRQRLAKTTSMTKLLVCALLLLLALPVQAQVGSAICSCSPPTYQFTLDFSLDCDDTRLPGPGIAEFECVIAPFQTGADVDLTPASVETTDFVEFDQALGRVAESSIFEQFRNGDTISYTSVTSDPGSINMPSVPKTLQITMLAQNSVGQPLLMTWMITFSNSCDEFPVISVGDRIGWTRFSMVTEPDSSLCPIADPTISPTKAPVQAPHGGGGPGTPTISFPTHAPIGPCRPYGSTRKSMKNKPDKSMAPKGKGTNIFYDPYYYQYYKGKGMSKSKSKSKKKSGKMGHSDSLKKHYYQPTQKYYYGKSGMKSSKSRKLKKSSHKHMYYAYPSPGSNYWYTKRKGAENYYEDDAEDDDDGYNDLPICPPPRPSPPANPGSQKSHHTPAASPTDDDDDQVHLKIPLPTKAPSSNLANPTAPGLPQTQESQEKPTTGQSGGFTSSPPKGPAIATWDDEGSDGQRVRAVLFVGAGIAAGVIAIIATYIYRREKQYVAKELSLHQHARSQPRRLGALPRQPHLPASKTMSTTVATESEVAALRL